jgi:hypothetical protein
MASPSAWSSEKRIASVAERCSTRGDITSVNITKLVSFGSPAPGFPTSETSSVDARLPTPMTMADCAASTTGTTSANMGPSVPVTSGR